MSDLNSVLNNDSYFKTLAETLPHILFVVDSENYQLKYINKLQPGFTLENVIGRSMFDFVSPEHVEIYKEKLDEVKKTGIPSVIEVIGTSTYHKEGRAWYRTHISFVEETSTEEKNSFLFLTEDITDYKAKELENTNKGEKLQAIINNTSDIICSIDIEYKLTEFNSVFFEMVKKGYQVELKPGMEVLKFIDPKKHDHLRQIYKRVEAGETVYDVEGFETVFNNIMFTETNYNPIFDIEKKVVGISIFSKDITGRVRGEQKIKKALKEKEVLLSEIHHRIKNNLAVVSSVLQLQELNMVSPEAKEALSLSRKRIKSTALIHELLYRNDSFEYINLNEYIIELFEYLKLNDSIKLKLNGEIAKVELSTAMPLGLMLNELMLNSFKHSYKGASEGQTEIKIELKTKNLFITYCDCKGEFPSHVDFSNSNTTGLTLIHTFAEQLNGKIELVSRTPPKYVIQVPLDEAK